MDLDTRKQRFVLLGAILFAVLQFGTWILDSMYPGFPHFLRFFLFFTVGKAIGDLVYFSLWPDRREWARLSMYLLEDYLTFLRFSFPLSVGQRWLETLTLPMWTFDLPPATLYHHAIAGPYLALGVYLLNRWLREEAAENSYRQARNLVQLP